MKGLSGWSRRLGNHQKLLIFNALQLQYLIRLIQYQSSWVTLTTSESGTTRLKKWQCSNGNAPRTFISCQTLCLRAWCLHRRSSHLHAPALREILPDLDVRCDVERDAIPALHTLPRRQFGNVNIPEPPSG